MQDFVHLRLHSEFSVTDSIVRIKDVVKAAGADHMLALAQTDLHNVFGLVKFYKACKGAGIKPIIGSEVHVEASDKSTYKIILLAKNLAGYREICTVITRSYIENKILDVPYIKEEWLLESPCANVIILSGGVFGDVGQLLVTGQHGSAEQKASRWSSAYPDNYYLELHRVHGGLVNDIVAETLKIADKLNIPVVATHPIEFIKSSDYVAHEVRICVAEGELLEDQKRKLKFSLDQYFLSQKEMCERFSDIPSAITNSVEIAKRCSLEITLDKYFLPDFATPDGMLLDDYLKVLSRDGLKMRLDEIYTNPEDLAQNQQVYHDRLEREINTIIEMGFAGYFLIVADFIQWSKENNIPVGPGRGSGAGSLVAFVLGITDIEPLRYGLLFERFLNPERVSMPDFDIDFCQEKRELVIEYVKSKYGADSVAQIATFGTMSSKAVIKDVGRALALPYGLCDSVSKMILNTPAKSYGLLEAYDKFPDLKEKIDSADDDLKRLWDLSLQLEDLTRSVGKHAAGVLIAPGKLSDFCPIYLADGMQTSQLDKDDVEKIGLVKFDFLGLRNLTIIAETLENIEQLLGEKVVLSNYDFTDSGVYSLLCAGNTAAVFQLESSGMRRVLTKLEPDRFEDIIALLALYRPGPLGSGMVDDFVKRKKGEAKADYFHDDLKECLESTYGVIVYQEQVMQISQTIGGYTLGGADLLRRAMGKKKPEEMAKHKSLFIDGALKGGYTKELAENLFDLMAKFAEYGFNKSHSAAYAVISYHTAYLKAHYLTCFMAATLSSELDKTDKLYEFYQDCIDNEIEVLAPDINSSTYRFRALDVRTIRYALGAIKGVGHNIIELIEKERALNGSFVSFVDFCMRMDKKVINKRTLESLIKAGAFDGLEANRAKLFNNVSLVLEGIDEQNKNANQGSLFDIFADDSEGNDFGVDIKLLDCPAWSLKELLTYEKQALGYYFSASLFDEYKDVVKKLDILPLSRYNIENDEMDEVINSRSREKTKVTVCGVITSIGSRPLKKGGKLVFVNIEDDAASFEFVLFNDDYEKYRHLIKVDEMIFVEGELMFDSFRNQIKITAKQIFTLDEILSQKIYRVSMSFDQDFAIDELLPMVSADGTAAVVATYTNHEASCRVSFSKEHKLVINYAHLSRINALMGKSSWSIN